MKYCICFLFFVITVSQVNAQRIRVKYKSKRNNRSTPIYVGAGYNSTTLGYGAELNVSNAYKNSLVTEFGVLYDKGGFEQSTTNYTSFMLSGLALKSIYKSRYRKLWVNIGGGGFVEYELVKSASLDLSHNKISPGVLAKGEIVYFQSRVGFSINVQQLYRPMSDIGHFQWRAGLGVNYIIKYK